MSPRRQVRGLQSQCIVGLNKLNPFASLPNWVGVRASKHARASVREC